MYIHVYICIYIYMVSKPSSCSAGPVDWLYSNRLILVAMITVPRTQLRLDVENPGSHGHEMIHPAFINNVRQFKRQFNIYSNICNDLYVYAIDLIYSI